MNNNQTATRVIQQNSYSTHTGVHVREKLLRITEIKNYKILEIPRIELVRIGKIKNHKIKPIRTHIHT